MKKRHRRIAFIIVGLCGLGIATTLLLSAFQSNLVFFFSPSQVLAKEAPVNRTFRVGGLVQSGRLGTTARRPGGGDRRRRDRPARKAF